MTAPITGTDWLPIGADQNTFTMDAQQVVDFCVCQGVAPTVEYLAAATGLTEVTIVRLDREVEAYKAKVDERLDRLKMAATNVTGSCGNSHSGVVPVAR